eukprot:SAG11_NODE_278_length_11284_cov_202.732231_8_plen_258_part_00
MLVQLEREWDVDKVVFVDFKECKYQGKPLIEYGDRFLSQKQGNAKLELIGKLVDVRCSALNGGGNAGAQGDMEEVLLRFKVPPPHLHTSGPRMGSVGVNVGLPRELSDDCELMDVLTYLRNRLPPEILTVLTSPANTTPWDSDKKGMRNWGTTQRGVAERIMAFLRRELGAEKGVLIEDKLAYVNKTSSPLERKLLPYPTIEEECMGRAQPAVLGMKRATPAGLDIIVRALSQILTAKKREYQGSVLETLTIDLTLC